MPTCIREKNPLRQISAYGPDLPIHSVLKGPEFEGFNIFFPVFLQRSQRETEFLKGSGLTKNSQLDLYLQSSGLKSMCQSIAVPTCIFRVTHWTVDHKSSLPRCRAMKSSNRCVWTIWRPLCTLSAAYTSPQVLRR